MWQFIAYYGVSEIAQRVTRLATTVLVARQLTPIDLGIAATAITCFEFLRVAANAGIGQAVIRASRTELAGICVTAYRLMWIVCTGLALLQCIVGALVAEWTGRPEVFAMIVALAGVYLMMPPALIQTYLIQRGDGHATIARVATLQAVADNALTIALALAGCGAWSIVLPKLVTCPIWMIGMRHAQTWVADTAVEPAPTRDVLQFALPILGTELLTAARLQLDKVLVGGMLGIEALGIYYFVFNAGIGLSLSLTTALSSALYAHFAAVAAAPRQLLERLDRSLVHKAVPIAGLVLLQSALAPLYVPLLFGPKWSESSWMVAVLCASAAAKLFADTASQALRAAGATRFELAGMATVTVVSLAALTLGLRHDLPTAVVTLALVSACAQIVFALASRTHIAASAHNASSPPAEVRNMITVVHFLNDFALGGVTRFLDALSVRLGPNISQTTMCAPAHRMPPAIAADVVVIHITMSWSKLPFLLALRARRGRRPIVLVEHSYCDAFERRFVPATQRFRLMLKLTYSLVDRVVAVSYGQAAWMRRSRLLPASKLTVIQPFTACDDLADLPPPVTSETPLRLGAYGRYCTQKGFANLIAAMHNVDPAIATLSLRGFGPDADTLRAAAASLPHVSVGDKVDALADFLSTIDAVVIPSTFEPFGQVALEARLAARPIIVTAVDGLPEQADPAFGFVVRDDDPRALADAIAAMATARRSPAWQAFSGAARASAKSHTPTSVERWQKLLHHLRYHHTAKLRSPSPQLSASELAYAAQK